MLKTVSNSFIDKGVYPKHLTVIDTVSAFVKAKKLFFQWFYSRVLLREKFEVVEAPAVFFFFGLELY